MIRDDAIESEPQAATDRRNRSSGCVRWAPLLSADEERKLADRIKGGDQAARRQLILSNLRVVVEIARRFRRGKVPLDDLIQEGNLGLIRASADFDPSVHGCRFYTYAEVWIRAYIHRALIRDDSLIRVPQHVFLQRKHQRRDDHATGPGAEESEDTPSPHLADRPTEPGRIARPSVAEEGEIVSLTEAIVDHHLPDQQVSDQEQRLLLEIALRRLNPVEAWVIRERYGLGLLIPEERGWSGSAPDSNLRDDPEDEADAEDDPSGQGRAYFHRSYTELGRDCGLSRYRLLQVEEMAIERLRDVLGPSLAQVH